MSRAYQDKPYQDKYKTGNNRPTQETKLSKDYAKQVSPQKQETSDNPISLDSLLPKLAGQYDLVPAYLIIDGETGDAVLGLEKGLGSESITREMQRDILADFNFQNPAYLKSLSESSRGNYKESSQSYADGNTRQNGYENSQQYNTGTNYGRRNPSYSGATPGKYAAARGKANSAKSGGSSSSSSSSGK
jgi:hypothetical protein